MTLFRGLCPKCNFPLWRPNNECRGCWLAFDEDDRNKRLALRFWGRKGFDWVGLSALGIARVATRAAAGSRAEANSTENSPATNHWLPRRSVPPAELRFGVTDAQKYEAWILLRAFTQSEMNDFRLAADMKIQLR